MEVASFLASLEPREKTLAMRHAEPWHATKGSVVFLQSSEVPAIWLLDRGNVRFEADLASGRSIVSALAGAGQCLGEVEVLHHCPALGSAITVTECQGWRLAAAAVYDLIDQLPGFSRLMMMTLARGAYLSHLMYQHAMLLPPHQLLALAMLNLAHAIRDHCGRTVFCVDATQETLAHIVATSRQFVSKHVRLWSEEGWIASRYGRLEIVDRAGFLSVLEQGLAPQLFSLLSHPGR